MDPVKRDIGVRGSPAGTTQPSGRHRHQAERERLPEELKTLSSTSSCLLHAFEWALPVGEPLPAAPSRSLPSRCPQMLGRGPADGLRQFRSPPNSAPPTGTPALSMGPSPQPLPRTLSPCPPLQCSPTCSPRPPWPSWRCAPAARLAQEEQGCVHSVPPSRGPASQRVLHSQRLNRRVTWSWS